MLVGGLEPWRWKGVMINERTMLLKNSQTEEEKGMELPALVSAADISDYKCLMFCDSTRRCLKSNA